MTPEQIDNIAVSEFRLDPRPREDGRSYWTRATAASQATRVLRVSKDATGVVNKVKLAVTSLKAGKDVFLRVPLTEERLRDAIIVELGGGYGQPVDCEGFIPLI